VHCYAAATPFLCNFCLPYPQFDNGGGRTRHDDNRRLDNRQLDEYSIIEI